MDPEGRTDEELPGGQLSYSGPIGRVRSIHHHRTEFSARRPRLRDSREMAGKRFVLQMVVSVV
jgi:hypothetical protein